MVQVRDGNGSSRLLAGARCFRTKTSIIEDVEKAESSSIVHGNCGVTLENSLAVPIKVKYRNTI